MTGPLRDRWDHLPEKTRTTVLLVALGAALLASCFIGGQP